MNDKENDRITELIDTLSKEQPITQSEIEYLETIDDAIVTAVIRVNGNRLRKYLRNWVSELSRQRIGVRAPKKI